MKAPKPSPQPPPQYDASTSGERIADVYDTLFTVPKDTDAAVAALAALAGRERVLELGIGTGRVALPLAAKGLRVSGIDASPAMVAKLRAKPGGENIPVVIGDFADVKVRGQFSMVYVVFNTFFALRTQEAQLRCFARVARRLGSDGVFVIEAFVPDLGSFHRGQRTSALHVAVDSVHLDASIHDVANQSVRAQLVAITADGVKLYPVELRYAWPAELDLMARLAGMRLRQRWGGWNREPFTAQSPKHVSLYELAPPAAASQRR